MGVCWDVSAASKLPPLCRTSAYMLRPALLNCEATNLIDFCQVVPLADPKSFYSHLHSLVCALPDVGESSAAKLYSGLGQFITEHTLSGEKLAQAT